MPKSINDAIRDRLLRRAVRNVSVENACVKRVDRTWRDLERTITGIIRSGYAPPPRGEDAVIYRHAVTPSVMLDDMAMEIRRAVQAIVSCLDDELPAFATLELSELPDVLSTAITDAVRATRGKVTREALDDEPIEPLLVTFQSAPLEQARQLLTSPLGGAAFQRSFGDLAASTLRTLRNTLQAGLARGEGVATVARHVQSVLRNKRHEAERIVRSEFVRVAGQAAALTYKRNDQYLKGIRWQATLDKRTCPTCGTLDGRVWLDIDKAKLPVTSTHALCRCSLIPIVKPSKDLGITGTLDERASMDGPVSATLKYTEWFSTLERDIQREILGPTRFTLYASGRLKIADFTGTRGVRTVKDILRRTPQRSVTAPSAALPPLPKALTSGRGAPSATIKRTIAAAEKEATFVRARTAQEARAFAQKLGVTADYTAENLHVANQINEALARSKAWGGSLPKHVRLGSARGAAGAWDANAGSVIAQYQSSTRTMLVDARAPVFSDAKQAAKLFKDGWFTTDRTYHSILHEVGHSTHDVRAAKQYLQLGGNTPQSRAALKAINELRDPALSRYALTDPREFIAEVFAGQVEGAKFRDQTMTLYRSLGGPAVERTVILPPMARGEDALISIVKDQRAFTGKQVLTKKQIGGKGRTKILGDHAERIVQEFIRVSGGSVKLTNTRITNYPIDLVRIPGQRNAIIEAVDVKAGEVLNTPGAQQWRITLGEPSDEEKALLKRMSAAQKKKYNADKIEYIIQRKYDEIERLKKDYGRVIGREYTVIVDADRGLADIYVFDDFHRRQGWKGKDTKDAYLATVRYHFEPASYK